MKYLYNDGNSKTTVYLANTKVDLDSKKYYPLDNAIQFEAEKWTGVFSDLRIVDENYLTLKTKEEEKVQIKVIENPLNVTTAMNADNVEVSLMSVPVLNTKSEVVNALTFEYNELTNELHIKCASPLTIVDINKKLEVHKLVETFVAEKTPELEVNYSEKALEDIEEAKTEVEVVEVKTEVKEETAEDFSLFSKNNKNKSQKSNK